MTDFRSDLGHYNCGLWASTDNIDPSTNIDNLWAKYDKVTLPARSCGRVGCYNTSGVYICTDQDKDIFVPVYEAAQAADKISIVSSGGSTCLLFRAGGSTALPGRGLRDESD